MARKLGRPGTEWSSVMNSATTHPKFLKLESIGLRGQATGYQWLKALGWVGANGTDGHLTPEALQHLKIDKRTGLWLAECGLWDHAGNGEYAIHDYADFQPTRETAEIRRQIKSAAGRAGGCAKNHPPGCQCITTTDNTEPRKP